MSREIKFRAWDKLSPKMYVGHSISVNAGGSISYLDTDGQWKEFFDDERIVVSQFTGLKDKNGKEIYEGDLVLIRANAIDVLGEEKPHKIVFGNYCIGKDDWGIEHKTSCFCIEFCDGSGYCGIEEEETIVVGNIYETI